MTNDFIYTAIESLSKDYKWTIDYVYSIDFYDFLQFYKRLREREEHEAKTNLKKLQMLTLAIHTNDPEDFIKKLENTINGGPDEDLVGDLSQLDKLKGKRNQYAKAGEIDGR